MEKKSDKKTIIALLAVLALVIIGGGIWTFKSLKPLNLEEEVFSDVKIEEVFKVKKVAIKNLKDFLGVDAVSGNIWDNFYSNDQVVKLQDIDIDIDIEDNIGNPSPFVVSSSSESGLENDK